MKTIVFTTRCGYKISAVVIKEYDASVALCFAQDRLVLVDSELNEIENVDAFDVFPELSN